MEDLALALLGAVTEVPAVAQLVAVGVLGDRLEPDRRADAGLALALLVRVRREPALPHLRAGVRGALHLILLQIALGIGVIVLHVPVWLASLHQAVALGIFGLALFICYRAFGSRP